jgi:uncharacterized membrane protein YdbT with pleckstrin-like domain
MVKGTILGIDPDEVVLHEFKRHPIGLIGIYVTAGFILFMLLASVFFIAGTESFAIGDTMLAAIATALSLLVIVMTYIGVDVYKTNELIITNENLIQILQHSLFDRKVSQLNLAKVQDVTVDQEGVIATMLGYGTVMIETAGEATNYNFRLTPNPNVVAKQVIEAHERYLRTHQIDGQAQVRARSTRPGVI